MKPPLSRKVVLLIAFLAICYSSSFLTGGSVRTDPFGSHASHVGHVSAEKLKEDEEDMVSMDYTAPRRNPPIHN
ncbi:hypothetical protein SESBI_03021 [Sesbania bispinosa]|nr:hypothetical protein SESBI_03021 [Sesbania bispinosa]